jgi:hypothetical protein
MARKERSETKRAFVFTTPQASSDEIAKVAFELFERRGRIAGHELDDWLEAERIVKARRR